MIPRAEVPRSTFITRHAHKTTFDLDYLIPFFVDEVLPGDIHQGDVTIFARLATLLFPLMDNITIETFFFFTPARILWDNWVKFMGERVNPSDSISYTIPYVNSANGGFASRSIGDYFGLPTAGTTVPVGNPISANALPFRAYNLIWNEWFRDENLQNSITVNKGDGPDVLANYVLRKRNKRHDYFTSSLPWPIKQNLEVSIPLGGTAPVYGIGIDTGAVVQGSGNPPAAIHEAHGGSAGGAPVGPTGYSSNWPAYDIAQNQGTYIRLDSSTNRNPQVYTDLTTASGATINALRLALATQAFLERDARGGTRYTELLRTHFGVTPQDARLQRPEYIGGGRTNIQTVAIAQTSGTGASGTSSPLGALGAAATAADRHSFTVYAAEHGYILGLVNITGDVSYYQGKRKLFSRNTRYDFYDPAFANLGEQAVLLQELYAQGNASDTLVFGYQERWAEYRDKQSLITGLFRGDVTANIDEWHVAQQFGSAPTLNTTFIEQNTPFTRIAAAAGLGAGLQVMFDSLFTIRSTRPLPMFSVPGIQVGRL